MFKDSLYIIRQISNDLNLIKAIIELNNNHEIFKGHFPSNPILPGVCALQITKEIIEIALIKKYRLLIADEIKFLKMIVPSTKQKLSIQVHYQFDQLHLNINVKIFDNDEVICTKIKASFIEQEKSNI